MSFGLRVKSFADGRQARSVRTLDMFLTTLIEAAGGLPEGFVVTFPKVNTAEHVAIFAEVLERLELGLGLADGTLRFEVQVETPRSVIAPDGAVAAPRILDAAGGRLTAMHVGVFDYTASLGLMPWEQRLDHPANDLARRLLQVALAGTGVAISDGSSNIVPASDRTEDVHAAWRCTPATSGTRSPRGSTRDGTCTPRIWSAGTPRCTAGCCRISTTPPHASAPGARAPPRRACSTSRRRSCGLLRYLRLAVSSGAVDQAEVLERAGLSPDELRGSG